MKENKFRKGQIKMIKDYIHQVKAILYTGVNRGEIKEFLGEWEHYYEGENLIIPFEGGGEVEVNPADYVIKEPSGHVYALDAVKFEEDYRENQKVEPANDDWKRNRDFSTALDWLKRGEKISRKGWNGKNMFVVYQKGYPDGIPCNKNTAEAWGMKEGELFKCEPYLQIKMVNGSHAMWVPSINDVLSNDWEIYEEE